MSRRNRKSERVPASAAAATPAADTQAQYDGDWYVADAELGQSLLSRGRVDDARVVFQAILARLGGEQSYRRAVVTERLACCFVLSGRFKLALALFRQAMALNDSLPPSSSVRALQGVLFSGLGDALRADGQSGEAKAAYQSAVRIAVEVKDPRARAIDLDKLGTLALAENKPAEAAGYFRLALDILQTLGDGEPEAGVRHHLGRALEQLARWDDAETQFAAAATLRLERGDFAGAAGSQSRLAAVREKAGRLDAAEEAYRAALDSAWRAGQPALLRGALLGLAHFLYAFAGPSSQSLELAEAALATADGVGALDADFWSGYGIIAGVLEAEACNPETAQAASALKTRIHVCRHVEAYGPRIKSALDRLDADDGFGRAVILERLGRCAAFGGCQALAATLYRDALAAASRLPPSSTVASLQVALQASLGNALALGGRGEEAQAAYESALAAAERSQDLRAEANVLTQLGELALSEGRPASAAMYFESAATLLILLRDSLREAAVRARLALSLEEGGAREEAERLREPRGGTVARSLPEASQASFAITLHEDVTTDCVFDGDLLVDLPRQSRIVRLDEEPAGLLSDDLTPVLAPLVRTAADDDCSVRFYLPASEPTFEMQPGAIVMHKRHRELAVSGPSHLVWSLIRHMDGQHTVSQLLARVDKDERPSVAGLLAVLAANGAADVSGRSLGRFVHAQTKKGVLAGGGMSSEEVLGLATDGNYRRYADAPAFAVSDAVPEAISAFHRLTRARRSRRDYAAKPILREEFDALLNTACGITGTMPLNGGEVKLRAYPSSGALYAVEIYPMVQRVDGLENGIYHYAPGDNALEVVRPSLAPNDLLTAALPIEREMVAAASVLICLVGRFPRHERKYGEGGYRMMVAEAGHISQNLVLSAVALGLAARPFGGVFDDIINEHLGLNPSEEQFLLSVLIGHAGAGQELDEFATSVVEGEP